MSNFNVKYPRNFFGFAEYFLYGFLILIYPFIFIIYGVDYTDAPWHYRLYTSGEQLSQYTFLSYITGNWISQIFGESIIVFRFIGRAIEVLSAILVVFCILDSKYSFKIKLQVLSFSIIGITAISPNILHYDVFSSFILSLIIIFGYLYIDSGKWIYVVIIGFLAAFLAAIRLPGVFTVFIVLMVIIWKNYFDRTVFKGFIDIISFLGFAIITYTLVYFLLYNNPSTESLNTPQNGSINVITNIINNLTNSEGSHNVKLLLTKYARDFFIISNNLSILVFLSVIYKYLIKTSEYLPKFMYHSFGLILFTFLTFNLFSNLKNDSYNNALSLFLIAFGLYLSGYVLYKSIITKNNKITSFIVFAVFISFVAAIGSDTGLKKAARVLVFIIPMFIVLFYKIIDIKYSKAFIVLTMTISFLFVSNKVFVGRVFEDDNIHNLNSPVNHSLLKTLKTSQIRKENIKEILLITDSLTNEGKKLVFYGTTSHLFSYLSKIQKPPVTAFKMQYESVQQADLLQKYVLKQKELPVIICLFGYPEQKNEKNGGKIEEMIFLNSYRIEREGINYKVFVP